MKKLMLLAVVCTVLGLTGSDAFALKDRNAGTQEVGEDLLAICRSLGSVNSAGDEAARAPNSAVAPAREADSVGLTVSAR